MMTPSIVPSRSARSAVCRAARREEAPVTERGPRAPLLVSFRGHVPRLNSARLRQTQVASYTNIPEKGTKKGTCEPLTHSLSLARSTQRIILSFSS